MNMNFHRKLPIPMEIKQQYPVSVAGKMALARTIEEEKAILSGASDKMLLIIGPCSADREDAFMEYIYRLSPLTGDSREDMFAELRGRYDYGFRTAGAFQLADGIWLLTEKNKDF